MPATLNELISDMESCQYHLQFVLNSQMNHNIELGQMYLVINNVGFGLYRLDDLDYADGIITLSFTNPETGNKAECCLHINNKHPNVFLVNWKDIEDMVCSEISSNYNDKELRELGNE